MTKTCAIVAVYAPTAVVPIETSIAIANHTPADNVTYTTDSLIANAAEDVAQYMHLYRGVARFELRADNGVLIAAYHIEQRGPRIVLDRITDHNGAPWITNRPA